MLLNVNSENYTHCFRNKIANPDAYSLALEAWQRGLGVTWFAYPTEELCFINPKRKKFVGRLYSISSNDRIHFFFNSRGDSNYLDAHIKARNKEQTKKLLIENNIPVPEGKFFDKNCTDDDILEYAINIGFPVVLKPSNQSMGRGVFANIGNLSDLRDIVAHVRKELNYKKVLLERYCPGNDYRIYVIENRIIGIIKRIPTNVTGDGIKSIIDLIKEKNVLRKKNPYLNKKPIIIDFEVKQNLNKSGYALESIPRKNEVVFLREKCNASAGGDTIDMTGQLAPQIEEMAIGVLRATGLVQGGVDLIVNQSSGNAVVIEVNSTAELGIHLFPWQGKARDIPAAIIDYYFPETKGKYVSDRAQYFDLSDVLSPIKSGFACKVEVMPPISGKVYTVKYIISGKVQEVGYRQWIKKKALDQKLHGYANNLKNGNVEVVVAGNDQETVNQFIDICLEGPKKAIVDNVTLEEYLGPVQIGFHINLLEDKLIRAKAKLKQVKKKHDRTKEMLTETQHKLEETTKKLKKTRRKYRKIKESRSWWYTEPFRKLTKRFKLSCQ